MLKLYCDRCGKEIFQSLSCLSLEIQERIYKGQNQFQITTDCLSASKILCANCDNDFKRFFNVKIFSTDEF